MANAAGKTIREYLSMRLTSLIFGREYFPQSRRLLPLADCEALLLLSLLLECPAWWLKLAGLLATDALAEDLRQQRPDDCGLEFDQKCFGWEHEWWWWWWWWWCWLDRWPRRTKRKLGGPMTLWPAGAGAAALLRPAAVVPPPAWCRLRSDGMGDILRSCNWMMPSSQLSSSWPSKSRSEFLMWSSSRVCRLTPFFFFSVVSI